jgi:tRNA 2-thiouridine synthesizing protein E
MTDMYDLTNPASLPPRDSDGFLMNRADWSPGIAIAMAGAEGVILGDEHWLVLESIRSFYLRYDHAPNNRALVNHIARTVGESVGNSTRLMMLFGGTPAKTAARWAGLPKPAHCL